MEVRQLFFEGKLWNYGVTEFGNVISFSTKKEMKHNVTDKGYHKISLQYEGVKRTFMVHRLVMIMFNPVVDMKSKEVNHIDGNKHNNTIDNLEWVSREENMTHAVANNLTGACETHSKAILSREDVIDIINKYQCGVRQCDLAREYKVHKSTIQSIISGRTWKPVLIEIGYIQEGSETIREE